MRIGPIENEKELGRFYGELKREFLGKRPKNTSAFVFFLRQKIRLVERVYGISSNIRDGRPDSTIGMYRD